VSTDAGVASRKRDREPVFPGARVEWYRTSAPLNLERVRRVVSLVEWVADARRSLDPWDSRE
jgi:hypothetical protein